ncbi:MAG TPA: hypothetical protein VNI01_12925, partial [Elusimicrobiota bacterium]|nr:hypothetical protein [Elusimicrobiota bacterium]
MRFEADRFEWEGSTSPAKDKRGSLMRLHGHVVVWDSTRTIRAGDLRLNLDERRAWASHGFSLDEGQGGVSGQGGEYDFDRHDGLVLDALGEYPPWRIWSRDATVDDSRKGTFRKSIFTSCDSNPPHYHFRASRVRVSPKKWMYATNVLFYLGRTPVFYTPFLWKSLRPKHVIPARVNPGYDHRNGAFLRTTTAFSVSEAMYGKLFLDYYGALGPGVGSELQFRRSENARGALFAYRIHDKHTGTERWALLGSHFQTLPSSFTFQGRLQAQSDSDFNNHFQRSSAFRVSPELINGAAVARAGTWGTTRILYSRRDVAGSTGTYRRDNESLPRVEFQSAAFSPKAVPVLLTVDSFADDNYNQARGFQQKSAGAGFAATQTKVLARGVSLTPRVAYHETYEDRRDALTSFGSSQTYRDAFVGAYDAGSNLRVSSPFGAWDAGYAFRRRFKPGTFQEDAGAVDYGIESNLATLQDTIRPNRYTLLRLGGGFDFRRWRDHDPGFRERVVPFLADAAWTKGLWQLTARDQYQLGEGNRSLILAADRGDRLGTFAGVSGSYNHVNSSEYIAATEFGWAPASSTWRLGGALRYVARGLGGPEIAALRIYEKELSITRDFHDFHTRLLFRVRPGGVKEAQARVELRLGKEG